MSIDPTRLSAVFGDYSKTKTVTNNQNRDSQSFDRVFDLAVNSLKSEENSQKFMIEQMRLAQIQLLQGLFSVEEGNTDEDFLSGFNPIENLRQLTLQRSQIVDKCYPTHQPMVQKTEPQTRNQMTDMIDEVANKVSLDPQLIHSVVSAESAFDPTAVSRAGAQGLMQLMPETAQELGVKDSFDPMQNLLGGSRYLKQLLEKYDGNLDQALAAYNWGQGNVDRKGLEQMPQETRDYLARVKNNLTRAV